MSVARLVTAQLLARGLELEEDYTAEALGVGETTDQMVLPFGIKRRARSLNDAPPVSLRARELARVGRGDESDLVENRRRLRLVHDRRLPLTRGDCINGPRPCPFVSCTHHLLWDVSDEHGGVKINAPAVLVDDDPDLSLLEETCALDVADRGGADREEVGRAMRMSRESVRRIEAEARAKARRAAKRRGLEP